MNGYTKQIAAMLSCSLDEAKKVQDYIEEETDIDYSECTENEFVKYVMQAIKEMKVA